MYKRVCFKTGDIEDIIYTLTVCGTIASVIML